MKGRTWYLDRVVLPCIDDDYDEGEFIYRRGDKEYKIAGPIDPWREEVIMPEPKQKFPHKFRLLDDDGQVYAVGHSSDNSSEDAFAPLDWAEGVWGCTAIEYYNPVTYEWELL